ncbi:MAG: restriction endonuclease subunit S [Bacteroidales bacterium]|nr:restriction endonuclease subunit S [Bacteroidales bacterium]MDY5282079.1 restriction endonuclease subunit S [Sodaliphilus sp.]
MEWEEITIDICCDLIAGYAFKSKDFGEFDTKVIRIGDITPPFVHHDSAIGVNLANYDHRKIERYKIKYNDFVLAMTGATIGKVGRYISDVPSYVNQRVLLFKSKEGYDHSFIYYTINSYVFSQYVLNHIDSESAQPNISANTISKFSFKIPANISDQRKIAGILSALDSKIENNNKINANLEAQAEALFKSWFVDFTPFKDQPFVDSELGPIPQGWKVGKLGDYCETICRGLTPKYNLDSKEIVLGQTCVRNNIVTLNNARKHQPKGKTEKKVQQWDTLINSTGIGSLGRVGIVYFDYNYVSFDSHITVVRATNPLLRPYIGRNLVSRQLEIENLAIGSTGQTELPRESVKSITLYIPTQKVLESFNCIIKPLSLKILKNIQENQRLAALRDTLLPKLMSGEIKL